MNLEKLERKRIDIISDFSEEELVNYVQQLTGKYYSSYLNNDVEAFNNTVNYLKEIISIYEFDYPNLIHYINYCLVESINTLLSGTITSDIELVPIVEMNTETFKNTDKWRVLAKAYATGRENYHKRKEEQERLLELEEENRKLKERLNNGYYKKY